MCHICKGCASAWTSLPVTLVGKRSRSISADMAENQRCGKSSLLIRGNSLEQRVAVTYLVASVLLLSMTLLTPSQVVASHGGDRIVKRSTITRMTRRLTSEATAAT